MKIAMKSVLMLTVSVCACFGVNSAYAQAPMEDRAVFWRIEQAGEHRGYLLGTIHSEDPRVLDYPEAFIEQLTDNRYYAMEMVPDLPTLTQLTAYMQYGDGTSLQSVIGAERFQKVSEALKSYQVPPDWIAGMKVWAVMMTLSVPPPQHGMFMDLSLSLRAAGAGMEVKGLESLEEQLSFLEHMPLEQQVALLDQALSEYQQVARVHDELVDVYLQGDLSSLIEKSDQQMAELSNEAREYFLSQGIDARNHRMLQALLPMLQQGRVFVAVGALHLPGQHGLVGLLRDAGYELHPLPIPFSAEKLE